MYCTPFVLFLSPCVNIAVQIEDGRCSVSEYYVQYLFDSGFVNGGCKLHHNIIDFPVSQPGEFACLQF
jgi:hypothetical protein